MTLRGLASGRRGPSFSRAPVEVVAPPIRPRRWLEARLARVRADGESTVLSGSERGQLADIGHNFQFEYYALLRDWNPPRELLDDAVLDFEGNMFRCSTLRRSMTWLAWLVIRYGSGD